MLILLLKNHARVTHHHLFFHCLPEFSSFIWHHETMLNCLLISIRIFGVKILFIFEVLVKEMEQDDFVIIIFLVKKILETFNLMIKKFEFGIVVNVVIEHPVEVLLLSINDSNLHLE